MPKSIMEMVSELVLSQSEQRIMTAEELDQLIVRVYQSFKRIQTMEVGGGILENINNSVGQQESPTAETHEVHKKESVVSPIMEPSESAIPGASPKRLQA
jgi:hypothetical protein